MSVSSEIKIRPGRKFSILVAMTSSEGDTNYSPSIAAGQPALLVVAKTIQLPATLSGGAVRDLTHPSQRLHRAVAAGHSILLKVHVHRGIFPGDLLRPTTLPTRWLVAEPGHPVYTGAHMDSRLKDKIHIVLQTAPCRPSAVRSPMAGWPCKHWAWRASQRPAHWRRCQSGLVAGSAAHASHSHNVLVAATGGWSHQGDETLSWKLYKASFLHY